MAGRFSAISRRSTGLLAGFVSLSGARIGLECARIGLRNKAICVVGRSALNRLKAGGGVRHGPHRAVPSAAP